MRDFLHTTDEVGKPEMPVKKINLLLPPGMEASNAHVELNGKRKVKLYIRDYLMVTKEY